MAMGAGGRNASASSRATMVRGARVGGRALTATGSRSRMAARPASRISGAATSTHTADFERTGRRMRRWRIQPGQVVVALSLLNGVTAALAPVTPAQSVSGKAFGAFVKGPSGAQQSAVAVLPAVAPSDGAMVDGDADGLSVPGTITTDALTGNTSGSIGDDAAAAQSVATVFNVNLLNGLITASSLTAVVSSTSNGAQATSNALGSTLADLVVNGVRLTSGDATVAPNTRITLPGVGYVVLNEQLPTGDGVHATGLTVNLIHVYLQSLTGGGCTPLGCVPGVP